MDFFILQTDFWFFACLESSHGVLSMIFGILGKFGIGIGDPKKIGRTFCRRKKSEQFLVEIFLGPNIFDFLIEKKLLKKSVKIQNFEISKNFRKNRNFKILNFH